MNDEAEAMHRELRKYGVVSEGTAWRMYDESNRLRTELAEASSRLEAVIALCDERASWYYELWGIVSEDVRAAATGGTE